MTNVKTADLCRATNLLPKYTRMHQSTRPIIFQEFPGAEANTRTSTVHTGVLAASYPGSGKERREEGREEHGGGARGEEKEECVDATAVAVARMAVPSTSTNAWSPRGTGLKRAGFRRITQSLRSTAGRMEYMRTGWERDSWTSGKNRRDERASEQRHCIRPCQHCLVTLALRHDDDDHWTSPSTSVHCSLNRPAA